MTTALYHDEVEDKFTSLQYWIKYIRIHKNIRRRSTSRSREGYDCLLLPMYERGEKSEYKQAVKAFIAKRKGRGGEVWCALVSHFTFPSRRKKAVCLRLCSFSLSHPLSLIPAFHVIRSKSSALLGSGQAQFREDQLRWAVFEIQGLTA